jgi:hypothetical protein
LEAKSIETKKKKAEMNAKELEEEVERENLAKLELQTKQKKIEDENAALRYFLLLIH